MHIYIYTRVYIYIYIHIYVLKTWSLRGPTATWLGEVWDGCIIMDFVVAQASGRSARLLRNPWD